MKARLSTITKCVGKRLTVKVTFPETIKQVFHPVNPQLLEHSTVEWIVEKTWLEPKELDKSNQ